MRAHYGSTLAAALLAMAFSISDGAASIILAPNPPPAATTATNVSPDPDLSVTTTALTYQAAADQAMNTALGAQFPTWKFIYLNNGLNGTLTINSYAPEVLGDDFGGAEISATYAPGAGDPVLADLHFIQLVTTNLPLGGGGVNGYIDPLPNDDTLPFYWTTAEDGTSKANGSYTFADFSKRLPPSGSASTTWSSELLLASWTDPGGADWIDQAPPAGQTVFVYDGVNWGWTLTDPADAVPEAGAWSLMIAGFLGLAAVARQRKGSAA